MNVNISKSIPFRERSKNYNLHASFWIIYLYLLEFIVYSTFEKYFSKLSNLNVKIISIKIEYRYEVKMYLRV